MRLFNNLVGLKQSDFDNVISFYIGCYERIIISPKNKANFLLDLRELRHDLSLCGIEIQKLNDIALIK